MKHVKSFTYAPKIEAVFDGRCTQTIRKLNPLRPVRVGDEILFHTWTGRPYASKWGRRMRVKVTEVIDATLHEIGMVLRFQNDALEFYGWRTEEADEIARKDFIDPPTGEGLYDVLEEKNEDFYGEYQIIRWKVLEG